MNRSRGFTLLELMIVVLIIAVLMTLAVTNYRRYTYRAHRTEGQQALMTISNAEENYFGVQNQYTADLTKFGYTTAGGVATPSGYYTVTVALNGTSTQAYTATAVPAGAQVGDVCGTLSIDNTGLKKPAATDAASNSNGQCW